MIYGGVQFRALEYLRPRVKSALPTWDKNIVEGLAGGAAACLATTASFPFDTTRTHYASLNNVVSSLAPHQSGGSKSLVKVIQKIYAQEGFMGFYKVSQRSLVSLGSDFRSD